MLMQELLAKQELLMKKPLTKQEVIQKVEGKGTKIATVKFLKSDGN